MISTEDGLGCKEVGARVQVLTCMLKRMDVDGPAGEPVEG